MASSHDESSATTSFMTRPRALNQFVVDDSDSDESLLVGTLPISGPSSSSIHKEEGNSHLFGGILEIQAQKGKDSHVLVSPLMGR